MAGNSDANGNLLFFTPPPTNQTVTVATATNYTEIIYGLYACNIQTDVLGKSVKVQLGNTIYLQIELGQITTMNIAGATLTIHSSDQLPIVMSFVDNTESLNALTLLEDAIDGQYVNCSD